MTLPACTHASVTRYFLLYSKRKYLLFFCKAKGSQPRNLPTMMTTFLPSSRLLGVAACLLLGLLPAAGAQDTAVLTTRHTFSPPEGDRPGRLLQGADGNFYGTTTYGGLNATAGNLYTGNGTVYRLTPAGELTVLHAFTGGDDGAGPSSLLQAADGNLYGVTGIGDVDRKRTFFRLTLDGALTTLHAFTDAEPTEGSLVQGRDGNFYGVTYDGGGANAGTFFRLTQTGDYTTLYQFQNGRDGAVPLNVVQAADGNFYGVAGFGEYDSGTIFRVTPQGELTTIYSFRGDGDGFLPDVLTLGRDGNLYGTAQTGGGDDIGTAFRVTLAGEFTLLHRFTNEGDSFYPVGPLVQGRDGNFYGVTYGDTVPMAIPAIVPYEPPPIRYPSTFYRLSANGTVTGLYGTLTAIGEFVQGADGNFYGTDDRNPLGPGSVFELSIVPHPAFFAGQTPLGSSVYYLGFAGGTVFGYYGFLGDPAYVYHFDLGYEYVFDANDGKNGVFLYDFKSGTFFYTSPSYGFPYLYDFSLHSVLYYYPDPNNPGRYNTNGVRYFYDFGTGQIITK